MIPEFGVYLSTHESGGISGVNYAVYSKIENSEKFMTSRI